MKRRWVYPKRPASWKTSPCSPCFGNRNGPHRFLGQHGKRKRHSENCRAPLFKTGRVFSHFSKADEQDLTYAREQLERYLAFDQKLKAAGVFIPLRHLCNSAGIMVLPEQSFEMVRSGIITYGLSPSEDVPKNVLDIRPVMSLKTHVIHTKMVDAGYCISYGGTYRTVGPTCVATLSVGYADGYPRSISNKGGRVLIHGQYAPILGRICMDQMMVDVTHIPQVQIGG